MYLSRHIYTYHLIDIYIYIATTKKYVKFKYMYMFNNKSYRVMAGYKV